MRLALIPLALAACSVVPARHGPDRLEALEARVAALEALTQPREDGVRLAPLANTGESMGVQVVRFDGTMDDLVPLDGAQAFQHRDEQGAFDGFRVAHIRKGSLGQRLGLRNGDVVHALNGHPVRSLEELWRAYGAEERTDVLELSITRRGEPLELQVRFAGRPQRDAFADGHRCGNARGPGVVLPEALLGMEVGRALLHQGEDGGVDGYRISRIRGGSLADELGLRSGDVVHSVNGAPLRNIREAEEVARCMSYADSRTVELTRRGERIELVIDLP